MDTSPDPSIDDDDMTQRDRKVYQHLYYLKSKIDQKKPLKLKGKIEFYKELVGEHLIMELIKSMRLVKQLKAKLNGAPTTPPNTPICLETENASILEELNELATEIDMPAMTRIYTERMGGGLAYNASICEQFKWNHGLLTFIKTHM